MRTYSFGLAPGLALARLYTITRRDTEVKRFTNWPAPLRIGSDTWTPGVGLKAFDISERDDGTPSSTQLMLSAYTGGLITPQDIADKQYEAAELEIDLVDPFASPMVRNFEFYGRIGSVAKPLHGAVTFEARSPFAMPRFNLVPTFTVMCRFPFGGVFCGVPVIRPEVARGETLIATVGSLIGDTRRKLTGTSPTGYGNVYFEVTTGGTTHATVVPTYDYTIGNTTTDGSVVFTARNAWERSCVIATNGVPDRHNMILAASPDPRDVDGWYAPGKMQFMTGRNKYRVFKIGSWLRTPKQLTTYDPAGLLAADGDTALIWPDCDKTHAMCQLKYANARRYGGFKYFEGAKAVASGG